MLLKELLEDKRLILASGSPRRRQLMAECGLHFEVAQKFECDESFPDDMPCQMVAEYLSQRKSEAYPETLKDGDIVVTADTVVIAGNTILGKPADGEQAKKMLKMLSGRTHTVVTGVTLRTTEVVRSFSVASDVRFGNLTQEEISYYVDTYRPFDKAGAYGIQEWIGYVAVEGIDGSFYNVMGLPIQRLYRELEMLLQK